MLDDEACREKLALIAVGAAAATFATAGAALPVGVAEGAVGGVGLLAALAGRRARDRDAVAAQLARDLAADWAAWGPTASHATPEAQAGARTSLAMVIDRLHPAPSEIVGRRLDAEALAQAMLARAEAALPVAYADRDARNAEAHLARSFLLHVCRRAYGRLLSNPDFVSRIAPDLWRGLFEVVDAVRAEQARQAEAMAALPDAVVAKLLAALDARGEAQAARDAGVSEAALVELARRVSADVADADQAMRELERAVEVAIRVQAEGAQGSNLGDFVDAVLARVAALSGAGDFDGAAAAAEDAFARWEREEAERRAAAQAQGLRLLEAGLEQDLLRRDPAAAAAKIAKRVAIETPDQAARFGALREVFVEWYTRGDKRGLNLDLAVAVEVARIAHAQVVDADQRGTALNQLGVSLWKLGAREAGTARLEAAVAAYRAALEEFTRARVPLDWAKAQNNLGGALQTLGVREARTARLEEAVAAYRAALEEMTRDRVPLDWAVTQMNLGNALADVGEREAGTARLEEAVAAYRAALEEFTRARVPLDWAKAQMNLGVALATLGTREAGAARLEEAVLAYRAALEELTRDRVPLDWANARGNQAVAMAALAERTGDAAIAAEAAAQIAEAAAALRAGGHAAWAETFERQLPDARALAERLGGPLSPGASPG